VVRFDRRQSGGGFIHDQDACLGRQGFSDRDKLALAHPQARNREAGIQRHARMGQQILCFAPHGGAGQHALVGDLVAEEQVGRDIEARNEVEFLRDHHDPRGMGVAGASKTHGVTVKRNDAFVRHDRPRKHPHQGRFPRAVLAEQHVHLAGLEIKIHAPSAHARRRNVSGFPVIPGGKPSWHAGASFTYGHTQVLFRCRRSSPT
jgi:hypothetical protein